MRRSSFLSLVVLTRFAASAQKRNITEKTSSISTGSLTRRSRPDGGTVVFVKVTVSGFELRYSIWFRPVAVKAAPPPDERHPRLFSRGNAPDGKYIMLPARGRCAADAPRSSLCSCRAAMRVSSLKPATAWCRRRVWSPDGMDRVWQHSRIVARLRERQTLNLTVAMSRGLLPIHPIARTAGVTATHPNPHLGHAAPHTAEDKPTPGNS